jgi:nucleoside-diphosphate-sugar epimerase
MQAPIEGLKDVRAAVVGASGFIGRRIARKLLDSGADVVALVRDPTGARPLLERVAPGAKIVGLDLLDDRAVSETLAVVRPAVLFNAAGYGVDRSERDPDLAFRLNVEAVSTLASAFAVARDRRFPGTPFLHLGSALEYGRASGILSEAMTPLPFETYGRTKLLGVQALEKASITHGLPAIAARLFTVYGTGEHEGRLLPTLLAARGHDREIPLSAGLQRRDFTAVDDVAEAALRLALVQPETGARTVNLATGIMTEVRDFAVRAARVLGIAESRLGFGRIPVRAEEMEHDGVAVARLRALTGRVPSLSIEDGVRRAAAETD